MIITQKWRNVQFAFKWQVSSFVLLFFYSPVLLFDIFRHSTGMSTCVNILCISIGRSVNDYAFRFSMLHLGVGSWELYVFPKYSESWFYRFYNVEKELGGSVAHYSICSFMPVGFLKLNINWGPRNSKCIFKLTDRKPWMCILCAIWLIETRCKISIKLSLSSVCYPLSICSLS